MISFDALYNRISRGTLVDSRRCEILYDFMVGLDVPGSVYECGVYWGGTAYLLATLANGRPVKLFDTFTGMPEVSEYDLHKKGDFADTDLDLVRSTFIAFPNVEIYAGFIPDTFPEDDVIAFAHVDVDIFQSVWDCCEYIVPRLSPGGVIVFDDYGFPSCPGAKKAVDEFFSPEHMQKLGVEGEVSRLATRQAVFSKIA